MTMKEKGLQGQITSQEYEVSNELEDRFEKKSQSLVREMPAYMLENDEGEYTIDDYFAIPDDRRAELIDGVIYDMAAPTTLHQFFCDELQSLLREYIRNNKGPCIAMSSPIDVQLNCDNKTMLQPDVIIICDKDKFQLKRIYGAPDLVIEVTSPSTLRRDLTIKFSKYRTAGVKEYWIVDLYKKRVIVYDFVQTEIANIYTFEDKVPVGIFQGKCKIDFADVYQEAEFLYGQ